MAKVALLNPPSPDKYIRTGRWTRKSRANQSWYPIWLAYATAILEREGHECTLIDAGSEGLSHVDTSLKLARFEPDFIAYYYGYDTLKDDLRYANYLGALYKVILVGPWGHCIPEGVLSYVENVYISTYGEFDHTLLEIVTNDGNVDLDTLGIEFVDPYGAPDIIQVSEPRPLALGDELDKIPFVTDVYRRHLDIKNYRQTSLRFPFVDLFGARSCPYDCTFCLWINAFHHRQTGRYRERSIQNIIDELWFIKNEMPEVKQIWFQDDTILPARAKVLSERIIEERLDICWGGYSRAEQDYETLSLMKESGLRTLHVGYETGDTETLKIIKKGITRAQMETFAGYVKDLNLWTCAGFMIFPWQYPEVVRETIQWAKHKIRPRRFSFTQLFPYPGTPVYDTIEKYKELGVPLLSVEEMTSLEREGFTEIYLKNIPWMIDTLKHPREWKNVLGDAIGLIKFLLDGD